MFAELLTPSATTWPVFITPFCKYGSPFFVISSDAPFCVISSDFDMKMSGISSEYQRTKYNLKSSLKEMKKEMDYYKNPIAYENSKYNKELKQLNAKMAFEIKQASLLFFLTINNIPFMLPETISNKIIQGLGSRVFTKKYRVEVPHNAYVLKEDGKLNATVTEIISYIDHKYYKCEYSDSEGNKNYIYLLSRKELPVGSTVNFEIDLNKVEIYENSLNIRLV